MTTCYIYNTSIILNKPTNLADLYILLQPTIIAGHLQLMIGNFIISINLQLYNVFSDDKNTDIIVYQIHIISINLSLYIIEQPN